MKVTMDRKNALTYCLLLTTFMLTAFTTSDDTPLKKVVNKIHTQTIANHQEKLFLHFDRPLYHAGDDMWFKAYLLNAANHKKEKLEKVIYLELINPNGKVVSKKIYQLSEGACSGHFPLSDDLRSGKYLIVAYTNWMRNVGSDFFFKQEISILNEEEPFDVENIKDTIQSDAVTTVSNDSMPTEGLSHTSPQLSLQFYPEGGEMVAGLPALIAFEGLNQAGRPMQFEGQIVDDLGNSHAFIRPLENGKGYFYLKPEQGRTYKALVKGNKEEQLSYSLPRARAQGFSINLNNTFHKDTIQLKVMAQLNELKPLLYLIGMQNGSVKVALQGIINGRSLTFNIPKDKFRTGVAQFTILDKDYIPRCERLSFINHYDDLNIDVTVSKEQAGKREAVDIDVYISDKAGQAVEGDFSVSITDVALLPDSLYQQQSLLDYLNLTSDIPSITQNITNLTNDTREAHNKMELLMLTNGWRRFNWKACLQDSVPESEYMMENGMYVKGAVKRRKSNKPAPKGIELTMITKGDIMDFYRVKTDAKGLFEFPLFDFNDTVDVVVQTRNKMYYKSDFFVDLESNLSFQAVDKGARTRMGMSENVPTTFFKSDAVQVDGKALSRSGIVRNDDKRLTDLGLADTTDVFIQEVEIVSNRAKTPKEEMTDHFGAANHIVGEKQIEAIAQNTPWHSGLIDLLFDAIPDLEVTIITTDKMVGNNVLKDGNFSREIANNSPDEEGESINIQAPVLSQEYIQLVLKGKGLHKFYLYIDGQYVGSTDGNGFLNSLVEPMNLSDLIGMDPAMVQSIELRHDLKNHPVQFAGSMNAALDLDVYASPPAVLAIYTHDGKGIRSKANRKGVNNLRLFGYTRQREFYSPVYDDYTSAGIAFDKRATLHWEPNLTTNAEGKATLKFFSSDVARAYRVDIAGLSSTSSPGAKTAVFGTLKKSDKPVVQSRHETTEKGTLWSNVFSSDLWQRYLVEYNTEDQFIAIVLDEEGALVPFADVAVSGKHIETSANASGIFALDNSTLDNSDVLMISNAGRAYTEVSIAQLKNDQNKVVCTKAVVNTTVLKVEAVMKAVYASISKKKSVLRRSFEGVYRQTIRKDNLLYELSDFGLTIEQHYNKSAKAPHVSQLKDGRIYKTDNYSQVIRFKPHMALREEVVQLSDPLLTHKPFVNKAYQNAFDYTLEGITKYRGEEVLMIRFKQKADSYQNFDDGMLLVSMRTKEVWHCEWQAAEAAKAFQIADSYIHSGHRFKKIDFVSNHNQCSFRLENGQLSIKHQYEQVGLMADRHAISYTRELQAYGQLKERERAVKNTSMASKMQRRSLINRVSYQPKYWRDGNSILPDFYLHDQVKYLHEIEFYKADD